MKSLLIIMTLVLVLGAVAITVLSFMSIGFMAIVPLIMLYALFGACIVMSWGYEEGEEMLHEIKAALQDWSNMQVTY